MGGSARLIVLHSTKFKENMLVLHTISEEYGRRSFLLTVGKGTSMALFLPLNVLEAEVVENSRSQLWRLRSPRAVHALNGIRGNVYKNTMTMFMSEVLYRILREGSCESGVASWCERMTLTLDSLESDFSNFHLRFLLELCGALGFSPSLQDIAPFAGSHLRELSVLLESDFASSMLLPLSGDSRNEIASSILKYLSYHCECSIEARSLKVLREVFG